MILLDTHVWVWLVDDSLSLENKHQKLLSTAKERGLGVSVISCWEVSKLVEIKKLDLTIPVEEWITTALGYPGVQLISLTPEIAIASTKLPGAFHRDPADQILVATARLLNLPFFTLDKKILEYPHVETIKA